MGIFDIITTGVKLIGGIFGKGDEAKAIVDVLKPENVTPEQQAQLMQAEQQMRQDALAMFQAEINDRANARAREIAMAQSGNKDATIKILALGTTVGFFGILLTMIFIPMQPTTESVVNIMVGALGASWGMVISYYFGSSAGSKSKDEMISKLTQ